MSTSQYPRIKTWIKTWIREISTPQQWKTRNKFVVVASLFIGGCAIMSAHNHTSNIAPLEMNHAREDHTLTYVRSNLLATSSGIEFLATRRIQLNQVQEWALSLKTQHSELPGHEAIAPKWNEFTSALHSLVEKTSALHAHAEWEIGLFADEYKITFTQGSKTSADLTNELAAKLLGVTKSLSSSVEVINVSMSESLQLHVEVYHALGASQIQIQNELRHAKFIGFKYVLGSEWQQKRDNQLKFDLAGLKLLQETGFLLWELKTKIHVYSKNLDVLQASIVDRQGMKKGRKRGLQVILNSFFSNNQAAATAKNDS